MDRLLKTRDITVRFGDHVVLDHISADFHAGVMTAVIGSNGVGKTTYLKAIARQLHCGGEVQLYEKGVISTDRRDIAYVPQLGSVQTRLTVFEMVLLGLANNLKWHVGDEQLERVYETLEELGIEQLAKQPFDTLSGGQKQLVSMAQSFIGNPKVLLLDEPLGALDLRLRKDMQIELKRIQQQMGITFVYVTHDQEEALTMSDTVVVMDKGRIQQIGTPEDIYNEPKNAFVADFIGESNILNGVMVRDKVVKMYGREFPCVDGGFAPNEPVDVVIRPEDIDIVPVEQGQLVGTVTSVTFKGMQYDIIVDFRGFKWLIQTTDHSPEGARIGVKIDPDGFHIMKKSEYSGQFGDYSSYSEEYEELADASLETDEEESGDEE